MPSRFGLDSRVIPACDLDEGLREAMHRLFSAYYDGADRSLFEKDLREKDDVVTIWRAGELCGFTTLQWSVSRHEGCDVAVLFSGDTIIDRQYWGHQVLAAAWLKHVGWQSNRFPGCELYWLLIVKGHRTFRYMPAFAIEFVPSWRDGRNTAWLTTLRNALARQRFSSAFDAATGLVRLDGAVNRLKPDIAQPSARERSRPEVAFFLECNPGYAEGDELVCLCPLTPQNMRPFGRRIYEQGRGA